MNKENFPQTVFADKKGKIFNFPGLRACGMKAGVFSELDPAEFIKLPSKAELFMLPAREPVGLDPQTGDPVALEIDPYSKKKEPVFAVAAFSPPGYTLTHSAAYREKPSAALLPLFAYGPCAFYKGHFYISAIRTDKGLRHNEEFMSLGEIGKGIGSFKKLFPKNRLIPHLANCAMVNACANAKNFFLGRFEAPIPVSPVCNAQCQGCISFQPAGRVPPTQVRIDFTPTPEEIAEIALHHIECAPDPIVSFGQGCEGEPTLAGDVIEKAIRLIRQKTSRGLLNINTNASRPRTLAKLFDAGLNNVRVSVNSVREPYYSRYYQPRGYSFKEVCESVSVAKRAGGFVSINYLSMPGFTDSAEEARALMDFISIYRINMIQWRNLNYDPLQYFRDLKIPIGDVKMLGMGKLIRDLKKKFPRLLTGYFNPRKSQIKTRSKRLLIKN